MWLLRGAAKYQKPETSKLKDLYEVVAAEVADMDRADNASEGHSSCVWDRIAPAGNIYNVNSLMTEHLKHSNDLQRQLQAMAEQTGEEPFIRALLDNELRAKGVQPDSKARYDLLVELLMTAPVRNRKVAAAATASAEQEKVWTGDRWETPVPPVSWEVETKPGPFLPIREFMGSPVEECWWLCGVPVPEGDGEVSEYLKTRFIAVIICSVQVFGPFLIFLDKWNEPTNYLAFRGGWQKYISFRELTCVGDFEEALTTILGSAALYIIYEIVRSYIHAQQANACKVKHLTLDRSWNLLGNLTNMWCILFTALCVPLVFWSEKDAKDVVYDSLALLFVFSLDDLAGGALDYLELDDDCFRKMLSWSMVLLSHCPVDLRDIVNPKAQSAKEIWDIVVGEDGLLNARTGELCICRLAEETVAHAKGKDGAVEATEGLPEEEQNSSSPFRLTHFVYRVCPGEKGTRRLGKGWVSPLLIWCWHYLHIIIVVIEVIMPPLFFVVNDPCYADEPHQATPGSLLYMPGSGQSHYMTTVRLAAATVAAGGDLALFAPFATSAEAPEWRSHLHDSTSLVQFAVAADGSVAP